MADYQFRYRLQSAPTATLDGSGTVQHDIYAEASADGETWSVVPGRHKTIVVPAEDLATVLAMPDSTGPQRSAKNTAYKQLLADNVDSQADPLTGWGTAALEALMDANDASSAAASDADAYITVTLGQSYPVEFSL